MDFRAALERLEESSVFREFKREHPSFYLAYCFILLGEDDESWQVGYYDKDNDQITSFFVRDSIEKQDAEKVFHKPEHKVLPLDTANVKIDFGDALDIAHSLQKEKYAAHSPSKKIFVLQNLENVQMWNITLITTTLHTINIKVDAATGDIISDELISFMQMGKFLDKLNREK